MNDRCMFIQQEISCAYVDDFLLLPFQPVYRNVVEGMPEAVQRHEELFYLTH